MRRAVRSLSICRSGGADAARGLAVVAALRRPTAALAAIALARCRSRTPISCPASAPTCCRSGSSTPACGSAASGRIMASSSAARPPCWCCPAIGAPAAHPDARSTCATHAHGARPAFSALVNWLYDALAIRAGILKVYNQPWADGRGPVVDRQRLCAVVLRRLRADLRGGAEARGRRCCSPTPIRGARSPSGCACWRPPSRCRRSATSLQSYARHGHHGCRPIARAGA